MIHHNVTEQSDTQNDFVRKLVHAMSYYFDDQYWQTQSNWRLCTKPSLRWNLSSFVWTTFPLSGYFRKFHSPMRARLWSDISHHLTSLALDRWQQTVYESMNSSCLVTCDGRTSRRGPMEEEEGERQHLDGWRVLTAIEWYFFCDPVFCTTWYHQLWHCCLLIVESLWRIHFLLFRLRMARLCR
jgi:hypothetical protein